MLFIMPIINLLIIILQGVLGISGCEPDNRFEVYLKNQHVCFTITLGNDTISICSDQQVSYVVPLEVKRCIIYFAKWGIHPFSWKGVIFPITYRKQANKSVIDNVSSG